MKMRMMVVGVLAMVVSAQAAVVAPEKRYAKPNEGVVVKFLNETVEGKKAMEKVGLAAVELEGLFKAADRAEVWNAGGGGPRFEVYTFEGVKLEPAAIKFDWGDDDGVDVSAVFPQIKEAGTYVLVWKDAVPLVIQTLRNPVPWSMVLDAPGRGEAIQKQVKSQPPVVTRVGLLEQALITTDKGSIKVKFAYDVAPRTVENFVALAREKFYDGSAFHRIIAGFMIQGGDSLATVAGRTPGTGGPGYSVPAELSEKLHERGTLSMARSTAVDSAGSQFFIMHRKTEHLDGQYTAFGDVVEGLAVVDEIVKTPVSDRNGTVSGDMPKIVSVRIFPGTLEMYGIKR
ncbi:MAG: peptidylprolyl isomerase [Phycisphaerales bacterium]|nr:peptidylprolyl isomerase [Phycisphaerales bacterium]